METFLTAAVSTLGFLLALLGVMALFVGAICCLALVLGDDWRWWQRLLGTVALITCISIVAGIIALVKESGL